MKHFTEEDVLKLKEQEQQPGGCVAKMGSSLMVVILVILVILAAITFSSDRPDTAVPTTATAIYGPTAPQLMDTPTLAPTAVPPAMLIEVAPAVTAVPSPTAAATHTPPATYTPLPTHTPQATYTPPPTWTPAATYTPAATFTPPPTWTAVPPYQMADYTATWQATRAAVNRLIWLSVAFIGLALFSLLFAILRPNSNRDLHRLYRLLEMQLLALLAPPTPTRAPVRALPTPVRTTPLSEYRRNRDAPVQRTGVTGVTGANTGAAPPEIITVSVQPVGEGTADMEIMQAICDLWNEMAQRGERPSFNKICIEYFGSKNSDRLALIRRAVKWGREQHVIIGTAVSETAVHGD